MAQRKRFNPGEIPNIMYEYLVEGRSLGSILELYDNLTEVDIANIFKPYGIQCNESTRGMYNQVRLRSGKAIKVSKSDISAYVASNKENSKKESLEDFLRKNKTAAKSVGNIMNIVYIVAIAIIIIAVFIMAYL